MVSEIQTTGLQCRDDASLTCSCIPVHPFAQIAQIHDASQSWVCAAESAKCVRILVSGRCTSLMPHRPDAVDGEHDVAELDDGQG